MVRGLIRRQRVVREKLAAARGLRRSMTLAEKLFWERVRGGKLQGLKFRRQQPIHGFVADFYCDAIDLVVELDGGIHQKSREADKERDDILRALGLRILRFRNSDIENRWDWVVEQILKAEG